MNLKISTRLLLSFGLLIALMALMMGLGVYAVTSIGSRLDAIVYGQSRDTMNVVDIRETVNEVARAVYNVATTPKVRVSCGLFGYIPPGIVAYA